MKLVDELRARTLGIDAGGPGSGRRPSGAASQFAIKESAKANAASEQANKTNTALDHWKAMVAHNNARMANATASSAEHTAGSFANAKKHSEAQTFHTGKMQYHAQAYKELK